MVKYWQKVDVIGFLLPSTRFSSAQYVQAVKASKSTVQLFAYAFFFCCSNPSFWSSRSRHFIFPSRTHSFAWLIYGRDGEVESIAFLCVCIALVSAWILLQADWFGAVCSQLSMISDPYLPVGHALDLLCTRVHVSLVPPSTDSLSAPTVRRMRQVISISWSGAFKVRFFAFLSYSDFTLQQPKLCRKFASKHSCCLT